MNVITWLLFLLVLVCVVMLSTSFFRDAQGKQRKEQQQLWDQMRQMCYVPNTPQSPTLFIMMLTTRSSAAASASMLQRLFNRAQCPFRVWVGMYEVNDAPAEPSALQVYETMSTADTRYPRCFTDHVVLVSDPLYKVQGPIAARALLMQQVYADQAFVMTLTDDAVLCEDWDTRVVETWHECMQPLAVMTAAPTPIAELFEEAERIEAKAVWADAFVKQFEAKHLSKQTFPSSFAVFDRFSKAGLPLFKPQACARVASLPFSTQAWSNAFSFTSAYVWKEMILPSLPLFQTLTAGEEAVVSCVLHAAGCPLFAPPIAICTARRRGGDKRGGMATYFDMIKSQARKRPQTSQEHKAALDILKSSPAWTSDLGIDLETRQAYGQAYMGVGDAPETHEITVKYGSVQTFLERKHAMFL